MIAYPSEWENVIEQINSSCLRLFDTWCETRSVTALAYLMYCWPLIDSTPNTLRRLGETIRDLRRSDADQLDENAFLGLYEMADLMDELSEHSAGTVRAISVRGEPK